MFHEKVTALAKESYKNSHAAHGLENERMRDFYSGELAAYLKIISMATGEKSIDIFTIIVAEYEAAALLSNK